MPTGFPGSIDTFPNPTAPSGQYVFQDGSIRAGQSPSAPVVAPPAPDLVHHEQHANANDAIHAIETKLGQDRSADPTSVDYRLRVLESVAGSYSQVSGDVPAGTVNGTNAVFTLSFAPNPPLSLMLFVNGMLLQGAGNDYTLSGVQVTLALAPPVGSSLVAFYLTASSNAVSGEVPGGAVNGSNATFTLAQTPNPASSLMLFANGILQSPGGNDFTLSGRTITFAVPPPAGTVLVAHYRT